MNMIDAEFRQYTNLIRKISHAKVIRIFKNFFFVGTRTPVDLLQRIDDESVDILKKKASKVYFEKLCLKIDLLSPIL